MQRLPPEVLSNEPKSARFKPIVLLLFLFKWAEKSRKPAKIDSITLHACDYNLNGCLSVKDTCEICVGVVAKNVLEIGESNFDVKQVNKQFAKRNLWISTGCKRLE